jgi:hypothetical protein
MDGNQRWELAGGVPSLFGGQIMRLATGKRKAAECYRKAAETDEAAVLIVAGLRARH